MPKIVDPDTRRREIARAAVRVMSRDGAEKLSLRTIAAELGGSLTMVTHYYPNRRLLMLDLAHQICAAWEEEVAQLAAAQDDAFERLRGFLAWLLPVKEGDQEVERARFTMLLARQDEEAQQALLDFDDSMREMLRQHLEPLVPAAEVGPTADILRAFTNGVVLDAQLNPEQWPAERQLSLLDRALAAIVPVGP